MYSKKTNATLHWIQIRVLKFGVEILILGREEVVILWLLHPSILETFRIANLAGVLRCEHWKARSVKTAAT
jgi:hypothetical protein